MIESPGMVIVDEGLGSTMVEADCFMVKACMLDCLRWSATCAFGGLPRGFFGAACGVDVESSCNVEVGAEVGASGDTEGGASCGEGRGVSCDAESEGK